MEESEIENALYCEHCGLQVREIDGEWEHADGIVACPPAFDTDAKPETSK